MTPTSMSVASTLAAALLAAALSSAPARAGEDESLDQAMSIIAGTFRALKPEELHSVLPAESKVFVSLGPQRDDEGYYGREQVYFMLQKRFRGLSTRRFEIRRHPAEKPSPGGDRTRPVMCLGTWWYTHAGGADDETLVHFVLSSRNGKWSLVKIQEAR
ncbi:MAG TPA: hypothetical protein VJV23_13375 [Candidatus Polarisedimenticolia bacterium]|nr:hypothetical protein [Candidatus Polarisedimenticolia bacterium]